MWSQIAILLCARRSNRDDPQGDFRTPDAASGPAAKACAGILFHIVKRHLCQCGLLR